MRLGASTSTPAPKSVRANLVLVRSRRKPGRKLPPPTSKEEKEFRKAARDPWLLATSLERHDADAVVALYAMRMQIEETFRDAKNHRFGWALRHVKTSSIERMTILLLITSLATIAVTLVGHAAERDGVPPRLSSEHPDQAGVVVLRPRLRDYPTGRSAHLGSPQTSSRP